MGSTIRWHTSDCSGPSVIVKACVPHCRNCDATSSVSVTQLVAQNQASGGDIHLPAATRLGEANLWWPRSVTYSRPQVEVSEDSEPRSDEEGAATVSEEVTRVRSGSFIYPTSLDSDRFRLIHITESEDASSPIHIRLEEYDFLDHPEYETVSYVWGGEDGDSTLCKPIYVGRFWDVILATRNCSALLNYLRPRRGGRTIWLDAICINQVDNIEKPAQISRMGDIYANCERVVAYLGEDLVSHPSLGRTFRPRIRFQKRTFADRRRWDVNTSEDFLEACANAAGMSQDQLFGRRYLSRIWIVQEILLSKQAIFPLGGSDILCDRAQAKRLILRTDRGDLSLSSVTKSLCLLLKATSHCHASDPRDRIYGLLGLFKPRDTLRTLVPDYSLSWRDCWVGTAAYLLLVEGNLVLLLYSLGNTRPSHVPSWVPDIQNAESWLIDLPSMIHDKFSLLDFISSIQDDAKYIHKEVKTTASGKWGTEFVMHSVKQEQLQVSSLSAKTWWDQQSHRLVLPEALCTLSMKSASIDSSNGALRLQVLRVFDGPCQLTIEAERKGLTSIWVRGASAAARFRVMELKRTTDPNASYQLFIISHQGLGSDPPSGEHRLRGSKNVLLALTTVRSRRDGSIVKLHECCMVYDVHFYSMNHLKAGQGQIDRTTNNMHSLHWVLHTLHKVRLSTYAVEPGHNWIFTCAFPSLQAKTRHILPLMIRLTKEKEKGRAETWLDLAGPILAAAKDICPDLEPDIQGNHLYLTIKDDTIFSTLFEMLTARRSLLLNMPTRLLKSYKLYWDERLEVGNTRPVEPSRERWPRLSLLEHDNGWDRFWEKRKFPFFVRFSFKYLLTRMKRTTPYTAMRYAREFSKLLNEDLETFLSRKLRPEDRCIFYEGWGRHLTEELGLVWKFENITIV